jgi:hypothetical protein
VGFSPFTLGLFKPPLHRGGLLQPKVGVFCCVYGQSNGATGVKGKGIV